VTVELETRPSLAFSDEQEAVVIGLGDIQLGPKLRGQERATHLRRLNRVIEWGVEHGAYFQGMGDYVDVASPSNREALKHTRMYDTLKQALEEQALQMQDEIEAILAPTRGRWLSILSGHHLWEYEDGTNTDSRLAEALDCAYVGDTVYVNALLPHLPNHRGRPSFTLWAWHGQGGGQTIAYPLNKLEKKVGDHDADIYMMGHTHKAEAVKKPRLGIVGGERGGQPRITHRDKVLVSTGSFLRGYTQGSRAGGLPAGGYVEKAGMSPVALGLVAVFARPKVDRDGRVLVDFDYMSL
jgi:hypothetical protein